MVELQNMLEQGDEGKADFIPVREVPNLSISADPLQNLPLSPTEPDRYAHLSPK